MADLEKTIEPAGEIVLSGTTYKLGKLNLADWAVARQWCADRKKELLIADAKTVYGDNIPPEVFRQISQPLTNEDIEQFESDPEWVKLLFQLAMVKYDNTITMKKLGDIITIADLAKIPGMLLGKKETLAKNLDEPEDTKA